jgi:hypothetical protein
MTDALQLIDFEYLKSHGVTDRMIELVNGTLFSLGEEVMPWGHYEPSPALLGGEVIHIRAGRKNVCPLYLDKDQIEVDQAWVHAELAKWIRKTAHKNHPALFSIDKMVMDAYRVLGCDQRFDEAHVVIHDAKAVMVYGEPTWRKDNDDTGTVIPMDNALLILDPYVPAIAMGFVERQLTSYMAEWEGIYGTKPVMTAFAKKVAAGFKLWIVIGNEHGAIQIQFNRCDEIDHNTMKPSEYVRSIFKDFK